jgi:general secretion pathway protein C
MAVSLNPRAERLLARLPRFTAYSFFELLLLVLIAVQCARLFWAVLTPLGPAGEWKALDLMRTAPPPGNRLGSFDPFFRQAPGAPGTAQAPVVVTALDIRLYGITSNQATGGGSAIIGTAQGQQRVFLVGEEIMPGVVLTGVGFDHITISRGGAAEQLYLDQGPAAAGQANPGAVPGLAPGQPAPRPVVQPVQIVPTTPVPPPPPPSAPARPAPTGQTMRVDQ